jgi:flagellar hook protein FlgE
VKDGSTGNLVNAAGFTLMGLPYNSTAPSLNSLDSLVPVNMGSFGMQASASEAGTFGGNLPWDTPVSSTTPPAVAKMTSLTVYDRVGNPVKINISLSKVGPNNWTASVATASGAPITPAPADLPLTFDADGKITGAASMTFNIPNGKAFTLDMSSLTHLNAEYSLKGSADGNAPSAVKDVEFASDGTVYAVYEDGTRIGAYKIPLATVPSPDNLSPRAGNVYEATSQSGDYQVGFPETSGFGSIASGALEGSNVDIGSELTAMIEAQTSYTANSKVFQTGSELLDVLMNLKR